MMTLETTENASRLLQRIGRRTRQRRLDLGLSIKALADQAKMSSRFLSDVEAGRGNIAVSRLDNLARTMKTSMVTLIQPRSGAGATKVIEELLAGCSPSELNRLARLLEIVRGKRTPRVIALLGIRGSGKSTVGPLLAEQLGLPFVELARRIEERAGMPLEDLFTLHGESYYRRVERRCLAELVMSGEACVAALPGGIVEHPDTLQLIRETTYTVWLKARPEEYWGRVFAQGDTRPMAGRDDAMTELKRLLARRNPLYAESDHVVATSGVTPQSIVRNIAANVPTNGGKDEY